MKQKQLSSSICFCLLGCVWSGVAQAQPIAIPVESGLVPPSSYAPPSLNWLRLSNIQVVPEGLLLRMNGNPQVSMQRAIDPDRLVIDLLSTSIPPTMHGASFPLNRYGIRRVRVAQFQKSPAIARIVLDLDPNDANSKLNWQSAFNSFRGGVLLRPVGGAVLPSPGSLSPANNPVVVNPANNPVAINPGNNNNPAATVLQSLQLSSSGQLLILQADRPIVYRGSEDPSSGTFNLSISSAQISPQIQRPVLPASSPLERIRLSQIGSTVVVGVKVAPGWRIREAGQVDSRQIALQLIGGPRPSPIGQVPSLPVPDAPQSLTNRGRGVIVIDPGHGGPDVGAVGNGLYEKNITLPISLRLGRILQQMGYAVVYTRTNDIDLDLEPRVRIAENVRANAFVSVHVNSLESRSSDVSGIETYHAPGAFSGAQLASVVHSEILSITGAEDRGIRSARFYVIRRTSMPAILVETGYVTNPQEAANLNNPAYQERMAMAIARGVDRFLRTYGR